MIKQTRSRALISFPNDKGGNSCRSCDLSFFLETLSRVYYAYTQAAYTYRRTRVSWRITQVSGTAIAIKDLARNDAIAGPNLAMDRHREVERSSDSHAEREGGMEAGFRADTQCIKIDR